MRYNILLVDDNINYSTKVKNELIADGYNVVCAYDGISAMELYNDNDFDIILLDMILPKKDGITVLNDIRLKSNVPIIMLNSIVIKSFKDLCFTLDCTDYVAKTHGIDFLKDSINNILDTLKHKKYIQ